MPIQECQDNNKSGYKWGDSGKCYTYDPNNKKEKNKAKQKAIIQGVAVSKSGYDK